MKVLYILVVGVFTFLLGWLLWIVSKPGRYRLTTPAQQYQLDSMLTEQCRHGNTLELFTDGVALSERVMNDLVGAQSSVHLQLFKFEDDDVGRNLAAILGRLVSKGVEARVLYDDFMCRKWRHFYCEMRRDGIQTAGFNPVHWPVPSKIQYYRNHRKCFVIDGSVAYVGGYNLARRYLYGLPWGRWRDTMVRIEGPAVAQVQSIFLADWCFATGTLPSLKPLFPALSPAGDATVDVIPSGPIGHGSALLSHTVSLLEEARNYIWFESPYFIPPQPMREALLQAARRGVDVRLLQPPRGDNGETTQWASKSYYAEAMRCGVRIGVYHPGYLHSKIIVCDDTVGVVGSCNIDPRSHLLCQEMAVVVHNAEFVTRLKEAFLDDEAQSHYIDPAEWDRRPVRHRLAEGAARTIASLL